MLKKLFLTATKIKCQDITKRAYPPVPSPLINPYSYIINKNQNDLAADGTVIVKRLTLNTARPKVIFYDVKIQGDVEVKKKQKLQRCLGGQMFEEYELNGQPIFQHLSQREKGRVPKVFGGEAKYNRKIIVTAENVASELKIKSASPFMSLIEIIVAEVKELPDDAKTEKLEELQTTGKEAFAATLKSDLIKAARISKVAQLAFEDPMLAVYHFRKHASEFSPQGCTTSIEQYFIDLPKAIIQLQNLTEVITIKNEIDTDKATKLIYITPEDHYATVIKNTEGQKISTVMINPESWSKYLTKIQNRHQHRPFVLLASNYSSTNPFDPTVFENFYQLLTGSYS